MHPHRERHVAEAVALVEVHPAAHGDDRRTLQLAQDQLAGVPGDRRDGKMRDLGERDDDRVRRSRRPDRPSPEPRIRATRGVRPAARAHRRRGLGDALAAVEAIGRRCAKLTRPMVPPRPLRAARPAGCRSGSWRCWRGRAAARSSSRPSALADLMRGERVAQRVRRHHRGQAGVAHEALHDQPEALARQPLAALVDDQRLRARRPLRARKGRASVEVRP